MFVIVNVNVTKYMPQKCRKMTNLWYQVCFFQAPNTPKLVFGRTLPRILLGELTMLPRFPSRLGRGTPLPIQYPSPLDAFGVSISASKSRRLRRLGCQAPNTNSWLRLWLEWHSWSLICLVHGRWEWVSPSVGSTMSLLMPWERCYEPGLWQLG